MYFFANLVPEHMYYKSRHKSGVDTIQEQTQIQHPFHDRNPDKRTTAGLV